MNFLAHLELAPADAAHWTGAILGDFVRGSDLSAWPPALERGIRLHRAIDAFTDADSQFAQGRSLLDPSRSRFTGLIVDIFHDHFLARDWDRWHPGRPLVNWTERVESTLLSQSTSQLGDEARQMTETMVTQRWLTDYASLEGVERAMVRMSHRRKFLAPLAEAPLDLVAHYAEFEALFAEFYPRLRLQVTSWLDLHPIQDYSQS